MILLHFLEEAVPGLALGLAALSSSSSAMAHSTNGRGHRRDVSSAAPASQAVPRIVWCRVSERLGLFVAHAFFPSGGNGGRGCVGRGRGQPFIIHRPFRALPSFSVVRIKYKARIPAARENSSMILASSQRSGVVDFSIFGRRLDVIDRCDLPRLCSALLRNQTSPPLAPPLPDDIALGLT